MEALLRPWFKAVDRLLPTAAVSPHGNGTRAPRWRVELYGGDAIGRSREVPVRVQVHLDATLRPRKQRQLRETIELFALALRIDRRAFMEVLADGVPWCDTLWNYEHFADDEALKFQVVGDLAVQESTFYDSFWDDLTDANSSQEYKATKRKLLDLGNITHPIEPTIELFVLLNCVPGPHTVTKLIAMLSHINREVFHVSKMLVVLSPDVAPAPVLELMKTVHGFRDTAEIEVNVDLPVVGTDHTELIRWKWLFDIAGRRLYGADKASRPCTVTTTFGDLTMDRRAGSARTSTAVACLSAIAHAGEHMTTVSLCMPLQDPGDKRHVRAKYLGYLLRSGGVENLNVKDEYLTPDDVNHIIEVYSKATHQECLQALYEPTWHGLQTRLENNATKYVAFKTDVVGVMHTSEDYIDDVFLAGYGQCGIHRSLLPETPAPPLSILPSRLKSLALTFAAGTTTVPSMVQLVAGMGQSLHTLHLECERGMFTVSMLHTILNACPSLQKLFVKPVGNSFQDDDAAFPRSAHRMPLQVLSVALKPAIFGESGGLMSLSRFLSTYTSEMREFEFLAPDWVFTDHSYLPVFDELFMARMPLVKKVRVVGFTSGFLRSLWSRDRPTAIEVLVLETVTWDPLDWSSFCAALSDPTHPLTQSVHTLHLKLTGWEDMTLLPMMLEQNPFLVSVAIDCGIGLGIADRTEYRRQCLATNGRSVYRVKAKLSTRHKAAFLSAVVAINRPIEVQNLNSIFAYAALTETRCVRLLLATTQAQPPMFW